MEIKAIGCEPLSLKRVGVQDGHTLKSVSRHGRLQIARKALKTAAADIIERSKKISVAWTRRCGFSDRHEMVFVPEEFPNPNTSFAMLTKVNQVRLRIAT
jgi:hypothetical protein